MIAAETRRTFPTPFAPLTIPLSWRRLHVAGAKDGPSEVWCRPGCLRPMLPLTPCNNHEDVKALDKVFPVAGSVRSNVPAETHADGASLWACFGCLRGVAVTWSEK
jgi:hypothetical protein